MRHTLLSEVPTMKKLNLGDVSYLISKLGNVKLFQYLNDVEKQDLLNISEFYQYEAEEPVITQGETSTCFFAILSGTVNVTVKDVATGNQVFLSCIGEGDFFGENGVFSNTQRTANVSAATICEIIKIDRDDFFNYITKQTAAGVKILMIFVNGLMKKLSDSNKELAFERRNVLDQSTIDQFLQNLK
jgi:CRP-like cAMP-binding protein